MKNNFEQTSEYDTRIENADFDAAYIKAEKVLSDPIHPEDFRDIYGENVDKDTAYVSKMERVFEEKAQQTRREDETLGVDIERFTKLAKIFEAIIFEHAELSNWFGEYATTIAASRYDDIKNGIDTIVEFEEEQSAYHLALAIDVTSSAETRGKFARIQQDIDEGHLAEIKYFVSEQMGIRGHKANVPRVVIGADRKTIYNVVNAWIEEDKKALAAHPIQIKILSEIAIQLSAFRDYCQKVGRLELAEIYQKGLTIIDTIMAEKNITPDDMAELDFDEVYRGIKAHAKNIATGEK